MAENDEVQCPSSITEFKPNQENKRIYLDEGRTLKPQDEAESNREDVPDAVMLFQELGWHPRRGRTPGRVEMTLWAAGIPALCL